jgi:fibronectin-binding autotransporter adhesin
MSRSASSTKASRTNSKSIQRRTGLLAAAVAGVLSAGPLLAPAHAGTFTWDVTKSSVWSDPTAWLGATAPTGADNTDQLIFGGSEGAPYSAGVDAPDPFIINGMTLNSSATTTSTQIALNNGNGILFDGVNPFITQSGTGAFQLDPHLQFNSSLTLGGTGTGLVTMNGLLFGSGALTVNSGTWRTTRIDNSFSGGFSITGGSFEVAAPADTNLDLVAGNSGVGAGTISISGGGELKLSTSGAGRVLSSGNSARVIAFGAGSGTLNINGSIPVDAGADPNWTFDLTNATGTTVIKFNGGDIGLSSLSATNGDWRTGDNALRVAALTGNTANTPIRFELTHGALLDFNGTFNTAVAAPVTFRGVAGGDVTAGSTGLTVGRVQMDSGPYVLNGGLFIEDSMQISTSGDQRVIDANITVRGTASGHAGVADFTGRGTDTALTQVQGFPLRLGAAASINLKTLTIEDGGIAIMNSRIRTDVVNFTNGVQINNKTNIAAGGTVRVSQSWIEGTAGSPPTFAADFAVGYTEWVGDIVGNGNQNKESVIEISVPVKDGTNALSNIGGATFIAATAGGAQTAAAADLIVNGDSTGQGGGLLIRAVDRQTKLYTGENGAQNGLAFSPDPVSNAAKLGGDARAIASPARLAALTGTGGFLTISAQNANFTFPAGGEWAAAVPVGLKVIHANSTGTDVTLATNFQHNINIASGAILDAGGFTLGPSTVTAGLGLIKGTGTLANAIINTGARLAPGFSIGTMNGSGALTLNGTLESDVTIAAQDLLAMTGNLSLGANSILDLPAGNTYDGTSAYTLATYSGVLNGNFAVVNNLPAGYIVDYGSGSNGSIRLVVPPPGSKIWSGATNGNWDTTTANWTPSNFANGNDVTFDDSATGTTTVNIVSAVTPASVTVNNTTKNYTIGGAAILGATGLTKGFSGTLTLTGNSSFTGPVTIKNGVISVASIGASGSSGPLGSGSVINMGDVASAGTLRITAAGATTNRTINTSGLGGILDVTAGTDFTLSGTLSGSGALKKISPGNLTITGNNAATFSGAVTLLGGTTTASSAGALGTGSVTLGDGTFANSGILNYNATGAAGATPGVTVTTLSTLNVGAALTAADKITVNSEGIVSNTGASLNRSTNLNALTNAILAETAAGGNNAVQNRGTASDIYFGLAGNIADNLTVGTTAGSTSWKGLSTDALADRTLNNGSVITATSDWILHSINGKKLTIGSSGGGVTINGAFNANVQSSVVLAATTSSYNNVNFDVKSGSTLELLNSTVLGSGANLAHVTVENGGLLKVSNSTAANGAVSVQAGGVMDVSIPGLSGTGALTEQPGGIVQLNNAGALTGTQLTGPGIGTGAVIRMIADNITNINTANGAAVFEVFGTGATRTEDAGINLSNGGILTQDNNNATLASAAGVTIGTGGGTLASTTGKTLSFAGNITSANTLTVGTAATIDGNAKLGTVALSGTITAPVSIVSQGTLQSTGTIDATTSVNILNGTLNFGDGAVLNGTVHTENKTGPAVVAIHAGHNGPAGLLTGTGSILLGNGGEAIGYANDVGAAPAVRPINNISNLVSILPSGGTITVDREGAASAQTGLVRFSNVQLADGSVLTMRRINGDLVADLTLLGNASVQGLTTGNADRIGNVTDNSAGKTLTITGTEPIRMIGTLQGTTSVVNIDSNTTQLNSSTFAPNYTSSFLLGGNTYEQRGSRTAAVNGLGANPLPGYLGSGTTTLTVDPGAGTVNVTGGIFNINATVPNTNFNVSSGRIGVDRTMTIPNFNLNGSAEMIITNQNATTFSNITITNFTQTPHSTFVFQPNADDNTTVTPPTGPGRTSFLRITNNPPANIFGTGASAMVSPSIIRKSSGSNEAFFLRYDSANGFMTAGPTFTVANPTPAGGNTLDTAGPNDIVTVDGPDSDGVNVPVNVTVPLNNSISILALKTDQSIGGAGFDINIGSGGLIFFNGSNQNRTISANVNFGNVEGFISGREGGNDFTANIGGITNATVAAQNQKNRDTLSGKVSGTAGFTKFAGGDLWLTGFNDITGPITVQRGRLIIGGGNGIGTGPSDISGDGRNNPLTLVANTAAYNNNSNHHPSTFDLDGNIQSVDGLYGTGAVESFNNGTTLHIYKTAGTATFNGAIVSGLCTTADFRCPVQIEKEGPGTQIFAPAHSAITPTPGTPTSAQAHCW